MLSARACELHGVSVLDLSNQQLGPPAGGGGGLQFRFHKVVKRIVERQGPAAAARYVDAVMGYRAGLSITALESALASGNIQTIQAALEANRLAGLVQAAAQPSMMNTAGIAGNASARALSAHGIEVTFNAVHPNVVQFAEQASSALVVGIDDDTRAAVRAVVTAGQQHGLTTAQQARALREVVGLPPNWVNAPVNLGIEIQSGEVGRATARRLSAADKQQIRSRIAAGTADDVFVQQMMERYSASLVNRRAINIARTEGIRSANAGVTESWIQARAQGELPATARRFWLVTPDERLSVEHARIPGMNPDGRGLQESFFTPDGLYPYPPSRSNCRCGIGLVLNPPRRRR